MAREMGSGRHGSGKVLGFLREWANYLKVDAQARLKHFCSHSSDNADGQRGEWVEKPVLSQGNLQLQLVFDTLELFK